MTPGGLANLKAHCLLFLPKLTIDVTSLQAALQQEQQKAISVAMRVRYVSYNILPVSEATSSCILVPTISIFPHLFVLKQHLQTYSRVRLLLEQLHECMEDTKYVQQLMFVPCRQCQLVSNKVSSLQLPGAEYVLRLLHRQRIVILRRLEQQIGQSSTDKPQQLQEQREQQQVDPCWNKILLDTLAHTHTDGYPLLQQLCITQTQTVAAQDNEYYSQALSDTGLSDTWLPLQTSQPMTEEAYTNPVNHFTADVCELIKPLTSGMIDEAYPTSTVENMHNGLGGTHLQGPAH
eukprot:GHVQ01037262.1.p1 GENE.GHVQ01037262.1~~GHVQ01037262.1.p1  ORF type:complete len:291 (-),score=44.67 GHVQ01037262.1:145-1017(-)